MLLRAHSLFSRRQVGCVQPLSRVYTSAGASRRQYSRSPSDGLSPSRWSPLWSRSQMTVRRGSPRRQPELDRRFGLVPGTWLGGGYPPSRRNHWGRALSCVKSRAGAVRCRLSSLTAALLPRWPTSSLRVVLMAVVGGVLPEPCSSAWDPADDLVSAPCSASLPLPPRRSALCWRRCIGCHRTSLRSIGHRRGRRVHHPSDECKSFMCP